MALYNVTGTIADWFSFVINAETLTITALISIKANKLLEDKFKSEGLSRGYKILDEIDELNDTIPALISE